MLDPAPVERLDDRGASVEVDRVGELGIGLGDRVADQPGQERDVGDALEGARERSGVPHVAEQE